MTMNVNKIKYEYSKIKKEAIIGGVEQKNNK